MVEELLYNPDTVTRYCDTAVKLNALRREVEERFDSAVESGDKQAARSPLPIYIYILSMCTGIRGLLIERYPLPENNNLYTLTIFRRFAS
jgi:hypothetical protein